MLNIRTQLKAFGAAVVFVVSVGNLPAMAHDGVADQSEQTNAAPADQAKHHHDVEEQYQRMIGLSFDLGIASAYVFRGLNIYQADAQKDQHAMLSLGLSYSIGHTGLTIGYWSAYQINGENLEENVDQGIGMEQDLYVAFEQVISAQVSVNAILTYYFFPFADSDVTGAILPSYLEPGLGISYTGAIDVAFDAVYFAALQESQRDLSHIYLHTAIGRFFVFNAVWGTYLNLGFGYKLFLTDPSTIQDNMFDLVFDWDVTAQITNNFSMSPGVHFAWTNLTDIEQEGEQPGDPTTNIRRGPGSEYVIWVDLGMGFDI